ncbi:MAG: ATP-binding protein [Proteobacteria bacterium]|nr:ATP-binding protein [Pseudomonadota bacterium]
MLIDITLEQALETLCDTKIILHEILIPSHCKNANSPYKPEYEWLFMYERKLAAFLETWTAHLRNELIGDKGILCEALSNAFCHGHKKDPLLPIDVYVFLGENGLLVRIKDTGPGFNLDDVKDQYTKGKTYFHLAGNGLRQMIRSSDFQIFYTDNGTGFNLMYLFVLDK